jgi:hypothetical protein
MADLVLMTIALAIPVTMLVLLFRAPWVAARAGLSAVAAG